MIHLQFFARYREQLGCDTEQLPWHTSFRTMGDVRQHLLARERRSGRRLLRPTRKSAPEPLLECRRMVSAIRRLSRCTSSCCER